MTADARLAAARSLPGTVGVELGTRYTEIAALLSAVRAAIGDPDALDEWLANLDTEEVAAQSYWHRNGFAKLVLHAKGNFRIRMHVWPAGGADRPGEFNPHGHRWNFASTVLCGDGLENDEYQESPEGNQYILHRYVGGGVQGLVPCGAVGLKRMSRKVVGPGEQHSVDIEVIHTVRPLGSDVVATLVVQSPVMRDDTAVYCAPGEIIDESTTAITPTEVGDLVKSVREARSGRPSHAAQCVLA